MPRTAFHPDVLDDPPTGDDTAGPFDPRDPTDAPDPADGPKASGPRHDRSMVRAGVVGALLVAALGSAVLLGWVTGEVGRFSLEHTGDAMRPTTAACFVLLGAALALAASRRGRRVTRALAAVPVVVALLLLVGDLTPWGLTWLDDPVGLVGSTGDGGPGRMPAGSALGVLLVGSALVLGRERVRTVQALATASLVVGASVLLQHTYGLTSLAPLGVTALSTGTGLVVLGLSTLLLTARSGYVAMLTEDSVRGRVVRRLAPATLAGPVAGGLVVVRCLETGVLDAPGAIGLMVTGIGTAGAVLVWGQAARLGSLDGRRADAEAALEEARRANAERQAMSATLAAAERHARTVIESAAEAYVAVDLDGRALQWNRAAEQMFGWTREEAIGARLSDLVLDPRDRPAPGMRTPVLAALAAATESGFRVRRELEMVHRDGHRLVVGASCWAVVDGDERTAHALFADLTGRRAAEVELRRANADLQDFAAAMAHDLRTPLTVIRAATELLGTDLESDPATAAVGERWIARIDRGTTRGMVLIDDILAFSALRESEPRRDLVDLTELARFAVDEHLAAATREVEVEVADCGILLGDATLLCHLLTNLVSNAFKHVPDDRDVRVRVTARTAPDARGLVLVVEDNGDVLPEDERESIFTIFQRGRDAQRTSGTGVGLAICQRVAELHDGGVRVVPSPLGGNRFEAHLATAVVRRPGSTPRPARVEEDSLS